MSFKTIEFKVSQQIAYITLNRPQQFNAINLEMITELNDVISELERNEEVRAVIITGNDKAFAAGADIRELTSFQTSVDAMGFVSAGHQMLSRLEQLDKPTIAVVCGVALGGGFEITLACDFRIASENARFGIPEINLGLIPGWGGASRLSKLLPIPKFEELLLTGDHLSARDAMQFGLVNKIVPLESSMEVGEELARKLSAKSPIAIRIAKRLAKTQRNADVHTAFELEKQAFALLFGTEDRIQGINAFLEKRAPVWEGR